MARRRTNNLPWKNSGVVEQMARLDLRKLNRDGYVKNGELIVYDPPILSCGLTLADLRHGSQYINRIVVTGHGVQQIIELVCRRTNFGGSRWYMRDSKNRLYETASLWGNYYASRQDIGVINYVSQSQARWSRLQRKKQKLEYKIEDVRGDGKVAARHRRQLQDEH